MVSEWCESLKHEDDKVPNPYCDCGMCELIDFANEAHDKLLVELCTCSPSNHYVFCEGGDKCQCGDTPKHEDGCACLYDHRQEDACQCGEPLADHTGLHNHTASPVPQRPIPPQIKILHGGRGLEGG